MHASSSVSKGLIISQLLRSYLMVTWWFHDALGVLLQQPNFCFQQILKHQEVGAGRNSTTLKRNTGLPTIQPLQFRWTAFAKHNDNVQTMKWLIMQLCIHVIRWKNRKRTYVCMAKVYLGERASLIMIRGIWFSRGMLAEAICRSMSVDVC